MRDILLAVAIAGNLTIAPTAHTVSRWIQVPAKEHSRANPMGGAAKAVDSGAALFRDHCAQCHGTDANGGGRKAPSLKTESIRSATDGDLEWFLRQGDLRHGMPSWSSLPTAQRWQIVTYLRSLQRE